MSGDERRYVPPDPTTTTDSAAPAAPAADPGATNPDDPNATDPDPPGAAPDAPGDAPNETVPDVPEPADRTPDEAVPREASGPQDVRVAPLNVPAPGPGRSGGTVEFPDPDVPATPPPSTPPPVRRKRGENVRGPLVALGIGVLVVAVALAAMFALGGGVEDDGASPEPRCGRARRRRPGPRRRRPRAHGRTAHREPTATPSGPPPTATGTPPDGTGGLQGDGVTYAIVQRDSGYYEGAFTLTNRTGAPLPTWRLSFRIPGADVRSAWGGRLVQGGERVVIENTPGAAAVPPGGTATITFGAAGTPAAPAECVLNGAACGL
ncbi:cellulose binding domain-containing protein [Actinomadura sp. CNU-125]|uniref:cellulose binding domain-containing protein n=1 Tax=Actinomadura sp. CNU-125 TaxID=1904961 RepID=UPI00117829F0|nr:cellulose binding domain-containing protein [Actinomadura sp. CNU-125]